MMQSDDMKTRQGMVEGEEGTFSNSWKTDYSCKDGHGRLDDPCSLRTENGKLLTIIIKHYSFDFFTAQDRFSVIYVSNHTRNTINSKIFKTDNLLVEKFAKHWCPLLRQPNSTFARCHSVVDAETYYKVQKNLSVCL